MTKGSLKIEDWKFKVPDKMRYETVGDWRDDGTIEVAKGLDDVDTAAVAIHELVERTLLSLKGIFQEEIDSYDIVGDGSADRGMYSKNRTYLRAHKFATIVEREIVKWSGRKWKDYDRRVDALDIRWYSGNKP